VITSFWTLARAGAVLGHHHLDARPLTGISTDTRTLMPGALFVALIGERFDAHAHLADAVAAGAGALVVSDVSAAAGLGVPVLSVEDTLVALGALARAQREAWGAPVIAIGGSNGKTTTKEMMRAALASVYDVHATRANHNNQVGVPLTLLEAPGTVDLQVLEVGTNHPGEIARLREIACPDVAVITTIQEEHLEGFGDLAGVMAEELSLCEGVAVAVVPVGDAAVVREASQRARRVITAGLDAGDVRPDAWGMGPTGHAWMALGDLRVEVPAPGVHNAENAVLALAVARLYGVSDAAFVAGLAETRLAPMRSAVESLGESLLLDDAYNANPASMRAAFATLAAVAGDRPRVALLGGMREMGVHADALHDALIRDALASGLTTLGVIGAAADAARRVAPADPRVVLGDDPVALWQAIAGTLAPRTAILLKGSRGERMERARPAILAWAGVA
jgi:UDP-N-acetylmuramoyl-tripeptide--D-alanyl-D-alanine ligase